MTQEDVLTKIVLETATKEDFFYISNNFNSWKQFLTQKDVRATLFSFGLKVYIMQTFIEITQINHPNHTVYTITCGTPPNNPGMVRSILHNGRRLFPV